MTTAPPTPSPTSPAATTCRSTRGRRPTRWSRRSAAHSSHLDAKGNRLSPDVTWNDGYGATGGGVSHIFARPAFQDAVRDIVGSHRGTPDISMSAAVDGGAVFYYSFCDYSRADPTTGQPPLCGPQWHIVGGTSEASPLFSGVVALADQAAGHSLGYLNPTLYGLGRQRRRDQPQQRFGRRHQREQPALLLLLGQLRPVRRSGHPRPRLHRAAWLRPDHRIGHRQHPGFVGALTEH